MAENPEETPENIVEEVEATATPDEGTAEAAAPGPTETRRERNAASRAAKAKAASGPRTLEERIAERKAHRERNARQRTAYRAKQKEKRAAARAAAPVVEEQHAPEHGPGRPKVRQGIVVSDKGDKTLVVRIDVARRHKRYQKILRSSTTLHVHDERNEANAGDTVRVQECRPMSRSKRWRLVEILERAR
ncbi:30S ribosomal protein S17 [Candidatus Solirubrobacter pratensis]|uniref:30S ribosomal protein S17 n=1 Tax=Candidatus Solirubrobacter pratensis TaxID=1298857 RepID=UPI0004001D58